MARAKVLLEGLEELSMVMHVQLTICTHVSYIYLNDTDSIRLFSATPFPGEHESPSRYQMT